MRAASKKNVVHLENLKSEDEIIAVSSGNYYYFENTTKKIKSKQFKFILNLWCVNKWPQYKNFEITLYSGRKHLFIEESMDV